VGLEIYWPQDVKIDFIQRKIVEKHDGSITRTRFQNVS
jgi:hypothetical protein